MNSQHVSKIHATLIAGVLLLSMLGTLAMTASVPSVAQVEPQTTARLLQFTSGGHVLGFTAQGMYAANGRHALHVDFLNANRVGPRSDRPAGSLGKAAALNQVVYPDLWPGITLTYTAAPGSLYTTTYTLMPGADARDIRLHYNGPLTFNKNGTLGIAFRNGAMTESAPIAWQVINGQRAAVAVSFQIQKQEVSFTLGSHDKRYPLTIDPSLTWNTFLGGSGEDEIYGIDMDGSGNVYVAGSSTAAWSCSPAPCAVRDYTGSYDAFVAKLDSSGNLLWNTFLGGSGADFGGSLAVDGGGNIFVTGISNANWGCSPVTCTMRSYSSSNDAFVAKLDSSGNLLWNTFLGGDGVDGGTGIVLDGSGNAYITGLSGTAWSCLPLPCTLRDYTSGYDAFAAKLDSSGTLLWNTFLGGSGGDSGLGIALDGSGNIYISGKSEATWGSPVRAYSSGMEDAFAAKLDPSGSLLWNTFLGGSGWDEGAGLAVDGSGNVFITGDSDADWGCSPVSCTVRAFTPGYSDVVADAFAAKLNSSGGLVWNTFLGGIGDDAGYGLTLDGSSNVYITGSSTDAWGCSPAPCTVRDYTGSYDAIIVELNSAGHLLWNTFLGGSGSDEGEVIMLDGSGDIHVAGSSSAAWSCAPAPCSPRSYTNGYDGLVLKMSGLPAGMLTISGNVGVAGATLSYTDGTAKTAISQADGSYSFNVSNNWSGTVTPLLACKTFNPSNRSYSNVTSIQTAQNYAPALDPACANVNVSIAGASQGSYILPPKGNTRPSYASLNSGPVRVTSANGIPIIASERIAYTPDGGVSWPSYSEMMGLPLGQLTTSYVMPWYNNADLNTQLRFGNVGNAATYVTVKIGGVVQGTYYLVPSASQRISYPSLSSGPVQITSSGGVPIIASERVSYSPDGGTTWTYYSEMMGLPASQLTTSYVMPWYNNADLNTQLRFGNVGSASTIVTVVVGGLVQGTYYLTPNQSQRISYAGLSDGPVQITSSGNVPIIASQRVAYSPDGGTTWPSFTELMGLPTGQLTTSYVLPVYDNVNHNTQLRFGNVGTAPTSVTVTIAGVLKGTYGLTPSQSLRLSYPGLNDGLVVIASSGGVKIIASDRVSYSPDGGVTWPNFAEMMGLPATQLATSYVMPWYNNADWNTQLRFAVP